MTSRDESRLSRRRFHGAVGPGAGALAVSSEVAVAAPRVPEHPHAAGYARVRTDRFGRIFRLPAFAEPTPRVQAALLELGRPGGLMDANDRLAAGAEQLIVDPA